MAYMALSLRDKYSEDQLHILVAKTNRDNYTYDGIDLGAERVTQEIETYIQDLEKNGKFVRKISIVGYSLGGLVARYVVGLLYSRGYFNSVKPINFTTFATPHLGVRTPILGIQSTIWNFLGSSTLSVSGRQLFLVDSFRETRKPLISLLADPDTVFMHALKLFSNRTLYANCINDRSAPYYTTSISLSNPFADLKAIDMNYLPDYAPNILDPSNPVTPRTQKEQPNLISHIGSVTKTLLPQIPLFTLLAILIPIGSVVFFINSGIQSVRSRQRIRLHEEGKSGVGLGSYRIPLIVEDAQNAVLDAIKDVNMSQKPLLTGGEVDVQVRHGAEKGSRLSCEPSSNGSKSSQVDQIEGFPILALSPDQFEMIERLDDLGFKKYRVHIHKVMHSHAAIVVRTGRKGFDEGKTVIRHWLEEDFRI